MNVSFQSGLVLTTSRLKARRLHQLLEAGDFGCRFNSMGFRLLG